MTDFLKRLNDLRAQNTEKATLYRPSFFRLNNTVDYERFSELISQPYIIVADFIDDQVKELIKSKHPQHKFAVSELREAVNKHFGAISPQMFGVWVYYPWSNRLVHILDREEFIYVRTSRNKYKITESEAKQLATKKIGVIGLSVGQSVSVTLAMERVCGEIRLADFDVLELTNLNRIRTGLHNLGLPKVYSVAREISEIDPFINVICFPEGLNENNMDEFFTGGGKLDLLVEESDGFDIKILCRHKARALNVPVIMEASDKCMVDVERFDLEPQRDILHGLVNHLDIDTLRGLKTNEEKIPYMLDVLGIETSSVRLKASMLEIEQTITTWPQLASAVTMGGGITADVSRRILLHQFTDSGRYYVDIEQLIGNKTPFNHSQEKKPSAFPLFDFEKNAALLSDRPREGALNINPQELEKIVEAGCKAPSGGNSQPWRWLYKNKCLYVFNAFQPSASLLDFKSRASLIALGAAIENVRITSAALGYTCTVDHFPDSNNNSLVGALRFFSIQIKDGNDERLARAVSTRNTNRKLGVRKEIKQEILNLLIKTAHEVEGADLYFITDPVHLSAAGNVLGELEKIRLLDKSGHIDFVNEMRWTAEENELKRDGIDIRTLDITNSERSGLEISKNAEVINLLSEWNGGGAFKKLTQKAIDSAGAIGIITMPGGSDLNYLNGGRALQRVWLEANVNSIAFQPVSASLFIYNRLFEGNGVGLTPATCVRLREIRSEFERALRLPERSKEIFIFRLSISGEPEIVSLRRPLKEVFCYL